MKIRFVIVFQVDGLDLEGLKPDLEKYGKVVDVEYRTDDDLGDLCLVTMESSLGDFLTLKVILNAVSPTGQRYVLFPMASWEDKMAVEKAR